MKLIISRGGGGGGGAGNEKTASEFCAVYYRMSLLHTGARKL